MRENPVEKGLLIVEDEPSLAPMLAKVMTALFSVSIFPASSAEEARLVWIEHAASIAAILTDVNLPDEEGIVLARELAGDRLDVDVVFMTGEFFDQDQLAREVGRPVKLLFKPFSPLALEAAFTGVLPKKEKTLRKPEATAHIDGAE